MTMGLTYHQQYSVVMYHITTALDLPDSKSNISLSFSLRRSQVGVALELVIGLRMLAAGVANIHGQNLTVGTRQVHGTE